MAMRNYGAMLDAKLMQCIAELRAQSGDAYDRVMQKQLDPSKRGLCPSWREADVDQNLFTAMSVADSRGLERSRPAPPPPPAPAKVNTVCRGCAGTGVDHTVHVRLLQAAEGPWNVARARADTTTTLSYALGAGEPVLNVTGKPLVGLLEVLAKAKREGRTVTHQAAGEMAFPLTIDDACTWCKGTGEPQSSPNKEVPNGIVA